MPLPADTRLGPCEILAPVVAGGMEEMYRARDERMKRGVAIKVLPASCSQDGERMRRFEQETEAAGVDLLRVRAADPGGRASDPVEWISEPKTWRE